MRVPLSWLRELVDLPGVAAAEIADRLTAAGLNVETVHRIGAVSGPLVVGRVLEFADETHKNGKTIRWCQVDTGEAAPRGIVCGALNFAVDDRVVVALPGTVLPGGFAIAARKTYGHVSDGMICSARELELGSDHTGILVLPPDTATGGDAAALLGLGEEVLDIAVTPDRGYALSLRGVAREAATAFGVDFADPAALPVADAAGPGHPVHVADPAGCQVFVARTVRRIDPARPSPAWLRQRLTFAGMRPISLVVDVTNYVMLELGQPIHAYDADRLQGAIVVRRAQPGESLTTLDGHRRTLDREDLLIADDSGPIGVAGVMGGASTEVGDRTTAAVVEAAAFAPVTVGRAARRHRLASEASRRFERGVDPALPTAAAQRVVDLLVALGGGAADPGATVIGSTPTPVTVAMRADLPARLIGVPLETAQVMELLGRVGCRVEPDAEQAVLRVTPPTWRPDLRSGADLVEEVARLHGYARIPSVLPTAPPGRGWTAAQRVTRRMGIALADAGYVEAPSYPFVAASELDALGLPADDSRRRMARVANPLSEEQPFLRTTLLPGLLGALRRNLGRGANDLALFEIGQVVRLPAEPLPAPPAVGADRPPTAAERTALDAAVPHQPRRVAVVLCGQRELAGWWGPGRPATWADAVEAGRTVAASGGLTLLVRSDDHAPWHPGRCAALSRPATDGSNPILVGHAGELHPRAVAALGLPPGTCAMEIDLDLLGYAGDLLSAPAIAPYPPATQDIALVVDEAVPAADVERALLAGAGPLLEDLRLFDVYTGPPVPDGARSLAYALRFRAPDRTLTAEEASAARDAAVAAARAATGATLRA